MLHYQVFTVEDMSIFGKQGMSKSINLPQSGSTSAASKPYKAGRVCFPAHETSVYARQNENINVLWYDILNTDITLIDCVYIQVLRGYLINR